MKPPVVAVTRKPIRNEVVKRLSITRPPLNEPLTPGLRKKPKDSYVEQMGFWPARREDQGS